MIQLLHIRMETLTVHTCSNIDYLIVLWSIWQQSSLIAPDLQIIQVRLYTFENKQQSRFWNRFNWSHITMLSSSSSFRSIRDFFRSRKIVIDVESFRINIISSESFPWGVYWKPQYLLRTADVKSLIRRYEWKEEILNCRISIFKWHSTKVFHLWMWEDSESSVLRVRHSNNAFLDNFDS